MRNSNEDKRRKSTNNNNDKISTSSEGKKDMNNKIKSKNKDGKKNTE